MMPKADPFLGLGRLHRKQTYISAATMHMIPVPHHFMPVSHHLLPCSFMGENQVLLDESVTVENLRSMGCLAEQHIGKA
jgi:hypothetical protein